MDLELDRLQIFQIAAREKSFSETARKMRKAQSAVSSAIAELEVDLGVSLFDRTGRYPRLTATGEALLTEVEAILSHCDSLKQRAQMLSEEHEARISIVVEDAFPIGELAGAVEKVRQDFPAVMLDFTTPTGSGMVEMVQAGGATFGLGCARPHYPQGIEFRRLGDVVFVNATRSDHPLSLLPAVRFSHLADHVQLVLGSQSEQILTSEYLKSPRRWQVQSQNVMLELLRQGVGWGIVPRRLIQNELDDGRLVDLKLEAYPFTSWRVGLDLIWKVDGPSGIVATSLRSLIGKTRVEA